MRLSTGSIFDGGLRSIQLVQSKMFHTQQQISTGRRVLSPADDPIAAARVLELNQAAAINDQYTTNRTNARSTLGLVDGVLTSISELVQDTRVLAVTAGNPVLSDLDRGSLVTELSERLDALYSLANSADGTGLYLFSGYQGTTQPFTRNAGVVSFQGDSGQRLSQVAAGRQLAASESGREIFENISAGNGVFVTAAAPANTGSAVVTPGSVTDPQALTGHSYQINFAVAAGTTYDVIDVTSGLTLSAGNAYNDGQSISFDGLTFAVSGAPVNGDRLTVVPAARQSLFTSMNNLLLALRQPVGTPRAAAELKNSLNQALANFDQALDHVLQIRSAMGARLKELDALDALGADLDLQYDNSISTRLDLDYAAAVTELSAQQVYLDAAQKSFQRMMSLSLFNYL